MLRNLILAFDAAELERVQNEEAEELKVLKGKMEHVGGVVEVVELDKVCEEKESLLLDHLNLLLLIGFLTAFYNLAVF